MSKRIKRAISIRELINTKFVILPFEGKWLESFGEPELTGSWIIWAHSGNGKTRFALQLAKYMTQFGRVAYNSIEEGKCSSLRTAIIESGLEEVQKRFILLDKEPISELIERLKRRRSPDIIFIDSVQYTDLTKRTYKALIDQFRNKLFIIVSHAEGKLPEGRTARSIRYDSFIKVFVDEYVAYPLSRYGGNKPFIVWKEEANLKTA